MFKFFSVILLVSIPFFSFSQDVFDVGVRQIEIFFNEANWDDSLDIYFANSNGQRLIADSVVIDGVIDENVGVKYRGNNSSYDPNNNKNPINIKLDYINNGQSIDGYNVLKLSNNFHDPSLVREILSYQIARDYMPAPKSTYANVFVDGVLIGLYTCVQSIDRDFTNEHFYERNGPFFKVENTNTIVSGCPTGQLGVLEHYLDTNCYVRAYDMESNEDWTDLGDFLDTLNNHFMYIENVMDIDRTLWMMAYENLVVALDGPINSIPQNFYLFKDNNGRFSPLLWDMKESFGAFTDGFSAPVQNSDLIELDVFHEILNNQNNLTSKVFSSDRYKRMYIAHLRTMLNEKFLNNNYKNLALSLQQEIDNQVSSDPNVFYSYSEFISNLDNSVGSAIGISELMNNRVAYLQALPELIASPPIISTNVNLSTNVLPFTSLDITATITNSTYAYVGYRYKFADKFNKLEMFDDGLHGDGLAGDGIFGVTVNVDARDIQYYFYAENNDAGIFSPQRAEKEFHQIAVVGGLVINEIMAGNSNSIADQDGEYDDWVELYNGNNFDLNLNGYYLSDSENDLTKWTFPNVTIAANDYLIVWCDTAGSTQSGLHTTYRLSADQEEVYLSGPTGTLLDAVHYVNMPSDLGYARVPNGTGVMQYQNHTYGASNENLSGIISADILSKITIYPNPADNYISISGNVSPITIFDLLGQEVYFAERVQKVDIRSWKSGIYFVESGNSVVKFIKH